MSIVCKPNFSDWGAAGCCSIQLSLVSLSYGACSCQAMSCNTNTNATQSSVPSHAVGDEQTPLSQAWWCAATMLCLGATMSTTLVTKLAGETAESKTPASRAIAERGLARSSGKGSSIRSTSRKDGRRPSSDNEDGATRRLQDRSTCAGCMRGCTVQFVGVHASSSERFALIH